MARTGIDKTQVFEAASALAEEGTRPTVQTLRERIGSGSYSTISAHLAEWKAQHATPVNQNIPPIPAGVQAAFTRIWATAAKAAADALEQQREAFELLRREMDIERADMAAEIKRLETAMEEQARKGEKQAAEVDELKREGQSRAEELTALKIENTRLEEQRKAAQERGDEIKGQFDTLQAELATAVKVSRKGASKPPTRKPKVQQPEQKTDPASSSNG